MSLACQVHGISDVGRLRQANEDAQAVAWVPQGPLLALVCDGMGGRQGGAVASRVAVEALLAGLTSRAALPPPQALFEALSEANAAVQRAAVEQALPGMGTTAVVAWVQGGLAWVGWVGDSRLYHLRAGAVAERTADHTRVQRLLDEGQLTPEQAKGHPEAHVLEQALGGSGPCRPEVWAEPLALAAGDALLLCSDGLYDLVEESELAPLIAGLGPEAAARKLVELANSRGGHDNITAVVVKVTEESPPPPAPSPPAPPNAPTSAGVPLWGLALAVVLSFGLGLAVGLTRGPRPGPGNPDASVAP